MPIPSLSVIRNRSDPAGSRLTRIGQAAALVVTMAALAALAGCTGSDDRDGAQAAPSASATVNGSSATALPPSPATAHPVDPLSNPATLTPQSTGPTAPSP